MTNDVVAAVTACVRTENDAQRARVQALVERLLLHSPAHPSRQDLRAFQDEISTTLPEPGQDRLALVYGGATKVKEYVFEAPKLPEIRGASALLDWVNNQELCRLWERELIPWIGSAARACVIYASGGNFLALAPAGMGHQLADAIEQTYTDWTLTALSVAVTADFSLLELRYGRNPLAFWVEDFIAAWRSDQQRQALATYYGLPEDQQTPESLQHAFLRRKTFGELVTVLTARFYRRREERISYEERLHPDGLRRAPRIVPFYPLLPWMEKCDSSDIRPAVWRGTVANEQRQLSEASARKRFVGQLVKQDDPAATLWFRTNFAERTPHTMPGTWDAWSQSISSWEQAWQRYIVDHPETPYSQALAALGTTIRPARDVGEIGLPSGRYIGMIYADGNHVGRLMAQQQTIPDFAAQSNRLREATQAAVFHALSQCLTPGGDTGTWFHPFEILTIGGDDLLLLVPGNRALDITRELAYCFERSLGLDVPAGAPGARSPDRYVSSDDASARRFLDYQPRVGLSAGVVIAQENTPIFFLRDLVEELLKNAKQMAHRRTDSGGAVDFMVLKSITMVTDKIKLFRAAAFGDGSDRRLIARPYTWHEFAGLLTTVRQFKQAAMPRSQLYRLREVLGDTREASIVVGTLEYLHTRARLKIELRDALLQYIEHSWQSERATTSDRARVPPWLQTAHGGWETIWADLVEIYDLIPGEEQHA